jgi:hypothetical protein
MSQNKGVPNTNTYANSIIKERVVEDGHIELEVIIGGDLHNTVLPYI